MTPTATAPPGLRAAAGLLFTDPDGRVLLVEPTYKGYWDLPGGIVEAGEGPRDAAQREAKEELGLVVAVGRLLVVDYLPPRTRAGTLGGTLAFVYDGRLPDGEPIRVDGQEIASAAWCTPAQRIARQACAPILARRIAAARRAQTTGRSLYLECGWEVGCP